MPRLSPPENFQARDSDRTGAFKSIDALDAIASHRAESAKAFSAVGLTLQREGTLSSRLVELLRLRIAFHNQCRSCMALRYEPETVDVGLVCSLEKPHEADDLSAAEIAALDFADRFATNHLSIDDTVLDGLRQHFVEGELVELGMYCAFFTGYGRLASTWFLVDDLPERFKRTGPELITPWETTVA